jgi:hypothetical protein
MGEPRIDVKPIAEPLDLPKEYGRPTGALAWETVRGELELAERYWIATVRPDGRPHVVPVDGIWMDDAWYYGGSEETVHHRSVVANPEMVMHLEDGMKAVIVEGEVRRTNPSGTLAQRIAQASREKYGYAPDPGDYEKGGVLTLFPRRVIAWTAFPKDATRFLFQVR